MSSASAQRDAVARVIAGHRHAIVSELPGELHDAIALRRSIEPPFAVLVWVKGARLIALASAQHQAEQKQRQRAADHRSLHKDHLHKRQG